MAIEPIVELVLIVYYEAILLIVNWLRAAEIKEHEIQ